MNCSIPVISDRVSYKTIFSSTTLQKGTAINVVFANFHLWTDTKYAQVESKETLTKIGETFTVYDSSYGRLRTAKSGRSRFAVCLWPVTNCGVVLSLAGLDSTFEQLMDTLWFIQNKQPNKLDKLNSKDKKKKLLSCRLTRQGKVRAGQASLLQRLLAADRNSRERCSWERKRASSSWLQAMAGEWASSLLSISYTLWLSLGPYRESTSTCYCRRKKADQTFRACLCRKKGGRRYGICQGLHQRLRCFSKLTTFDFCALTNRPFSFNIHARHHLGLDKHHFGEDLKKHKSASSIYQDLWRSNSPSL